LKKQETFISKNEIKYWDIIYPPIVNMELPHGYCFYKNGTFEKFVYYKNKRYNVDISDIEYTLNWKCLDDSFILVYKDKVKILKLNEDTFNIQFRNKSIIKFIRSKDQTDKISHHFPYKDFISGDTIHIPN
jgi:hypothetical protein